MTAPLERIYADIINDPMNQHFPAGFQPLYTASEKAKIVLVGQTPGRKAQETRKPWNDASGVKLRSWLGLSDEESYNPAILSLLPMDFYYPGKGPYGDLPPRKDFAPTWHPKLLTEMPHTKLFILVGSYAQKYYLGKNAKPTLTETVRAYKDIYRSFFRSCILRH